MDQVVIDNFVFRLHYKLTFLILLALSILITWRVHFGSAINCVPAAGWSNSFVNEYCYIHSTYSIKEAWNKTVGVEIPYPGMDKSKFSTDQTLIYHTYYQWVPHVLFIQAVLFTIPRCFWKCIESGKIKEIMKDLEKCNGIHEDLRQEKLRILYQHLHFKFSNHNWKYFVFYSVAEFLNVVNVIGQIFLMDGFLGGRFSSYGPEVLKFSDWSFRNALNPVNQIFPKMAKCTIYIYGASGHVQGHHTMCVLPLNILNEKIYVFLWFWFVGLAILSCLTVIYRIMFCLWSEKTWNLISRMNLVKSENLNALVSKYSAADFFLIRLLFQNLSSVDFEDLKENLVKESLRHSKLSVDETVM